MLTYLALSYCLLIASGASADRIEPHSNHDNNNNNNNNSNNSNSCHCGDASHTKSWCHTKNKLFKHSFTWTISNFSLFHGLNIGDSIDSTTFPSDPAYPSKWQLKIYLIGEASEHEERLLFRLALNETETPNELVTYGFETSMITGGDRPAIKTGSSEPAQLRAGGEWYFKAFRNSSRLTELLRDDKLTIRCQVYEYPGTRQLSDQTLLATSAESGLKRDFAHLLESEETSDVTVVVAGRRREFKAHKAILGARSPVFRRMLRQESQSSRLELNDFEPHVFQAVLGYIYTEKSVLDERFDDNQERFNLAVDLLKAATKLEIDSLKAICEYVLYKYLTVSSVVDIISLAGQYKSTWLRERAIDFIRLEADEFARTGGWELMARQSPDLAGEVLARCSPSSEPRHNLPPQSDGGHDD